MSSVFARTRVLRFYKNNRTVGFSNPHRRWFYHYLFAGLGLGGLAYMAGAYQLAKAEGRRHADQRGERMCSASMVDFLCLLPFNRFSNAVGRLLEGALLPTWAHHSGIRALARYAGEPTPTEEELAAYPTLQDYYARDWKDGERPVSSSARVVAPCDGVLLSVQEDVTERTMMHVKGLHYGIHSLFRFYPGEVPKGYKRVAYVVRLRLGDYHHVISPAHFNCAECIYVPGALLPATVGGYHWIPAVLTHNERLVVRGTSFDAQRSLVALAMVGSTLNGNLKLAFDQRVKTNFLDPPDYAVHTPYKSAPLLAAGTKVGTFYWGSAVVLLMDVPEKATLVHKAGDTIKAGEALVSDG